MISLMKFAARARTDDGFSLVEASVALVVAVVLFAVLGTMFMASLRQSREARGQAVATELSVEGIEVVRALPWAELAMVDTQAGDPRISGGQLLAAAVDLAANEDLVIDASLGSVQSKYTVTIDGLDYDVHQYVTSVDTELRRAVVVVTWDAGPGIRSHHTSSLVSSARAEA
jgi:Tfp pilus assembly protein PilV